MWLLDSLRGEFENARIMTYGFDAKLQGSDSRQGFDAFASYLRRSMKYLDGHPISFSPDEDLDLPSEINNICITTPLIFIAHSLGGLVVKEVLYHFLPRNVLGV